jgi:hypothetical protein
LNSRRDGAHLPLAELGIWGDVNACCALERKERTMHYEVISADCHVDLRWLPPDLFVNQSSSALRDRMPYVTDGPNGRTWMTKRGANLDLMN